jgi:hypothetical protein
VPGLEKSLSKSLKITAVLVLAVMGVSILSRKFFWGAGFLLGNLWAIANFLFTSSLFKIAAGKNVNAKLAAILLAKFPLLYLIGFLLLASKLFPPSSLLAGLLPFLIITGIARKSP